MATTEQIVRAIRKGMAAQIELNIEDKKPHLVRIAELLTLIRFADDDDEFNSYATDVYSLIQEIIDERTNNYDFSDEN